MCFQDAVNIFRGPSSIDLVHLEKKETTSNRDIDFGVMLCKVIKE